MISYDDRVSQARSVRHRYVNTTGMNPDEAEYFRSLISDLGMALDNAWYGWNYCAIPCQTAAANRMIYPGSPFARLVPKRFIHSHFFWASMLRRNNETVILDPTGVPVDFPETISEIAPYFGIASEAPEPHRRIYARMQDMDD